MMNLDHLTVREFGILYRGGVRSRIDNQSMNETDWDWLRDQAPRFADDGGQFLRPILKNRTFALQVCNFVGLIQLPSGQILEILPKISEHHTIDESRSSVFKMLSRVHHLPLKQSNDTNLAMFQRPLIEILIGRFLQVVQQVINRGLKYDYLSVDENSTYLRGKLKVNQYAQAPPSRRLRFPVEYSEYVSDRPENRLLHWAVGTVFRWSKDSHHRTHARKIMMLLSEIPVSAEPIADMRQWSHQRLMSHYRPLKPWIDLILSGQSPLTQKGAHSGVSMLFPMEKLFERYVAEVLRSHLTPGFSLLHDREGGKLAKHENKFLVSLRPDIQIQQNNQTVSIMDAKWKRLKASTKGSGVASNISRTDLYQMFAYAKKILPQGGNLFLIFPKSSDFHEQMSAIQLSDNHKLWIVPFDLAAERVDWGVDFLTHEK